MIDSQRFSDDDDVEDDKSEDDNDLGDGPQSRRRQSALNQSVNQVGERSLNQSVNQVGERKLWFPSVHASVSRLAYFFVGLIFCSHRYRLSFNVLDLPFSISLF